MFNQRKEDKPLSENADLESKSVNWKGFFKLFLFRVPLWIIVPIVIVFFVSSLVSNMNSEDPVNLRPAISDAVKVDIEITTCNENIDKAGFDIRSEERRLEKKFEETEGVDKSNVLIERDEKACEKRKEE